MFLVRYEIVSRQPPGSVMHISSKEAAFPPPPPVPLLSFHNKEC